MCMQTRRAQPALSPASLVLPAGGAKETLSQDCKRIQRNRHIIMEFSNSKQATLSWCRAVPAWATQIPNGKCRMWRVRCLPKPEPDYYAGNEEADLLLHWAWPSPPLQDSPAFSWTALPTSPALSHGSASLWSWMPQGAPSPTSWKHCAWRYCFPSPHSSDITPPVTETAGRDFHFSIGNCGFC